MQHSNLPGKPAAGVFLQGKRQLHKQSRTTTTSMTNLDRETQKIQKRLVKPQVTRLKHKWSKKKKNVHARRNRRTSNACCIKAIIQPVTKIV